MRWSLGRQIWLLFLPLLILLPALPAFPYSYPDAAYSDLTISHYPNALFLREALREYFSVPLWSPLILSGAPFAANPLSGLWYPPGWLALLFPLPLGFNLTILAHLLWGGVGIYVLLQAEGLSPGAALLGALTFEAMPKLFAHYGAGHLTLLYAIPWTPWLLWAARYASGRLTDRAKMILMALQSAILALIFMADVRWAAYAGIIWWAYSLMRIRAGDKLGNMRSFPRRTLILILQTILAGLLAAPLALPLWEFTSLSSRNLMTVEDIFEYSLPPVKLISLIYPDYGGYHEWMIYMGGAVLILFLLALMWSSSQHGSRFWVWIAMLSLLFSMGSYIPFITFLARLPVINLLRVPSRALFLVGLSLAILASYATEALLAVSGLSPVERRRASLLFAALAGFTLVLSFSLWIISGELVSNFVWGSVIILAGTVWIGLRLGGWLPEKIWYVGLLGICLLDWGAVDLSVFTTRPVSSVLAEGQAVTQLLLGETGQYRNYSPSYSLPQQTAANHGLELADGVDPMQLQAYIRFMEGASGIPWTGYSVTVPPFAKGEPESDNASYRPDPALLGMLNVKFVVAEYELPVEGLVQRSQIGETRIYENLEVLPRAWLQPEDAPPGEGAQPVDVTLWSPNRIEMTVEGPGLLVLSEISYPGWQVWVNCEKAEMELIADLLRGVRLGSGIHQVVFTFRPMSLYLGLALSVLAIVILGIRVALR